MEPIRKPFLQAGALHRQINLFGFWDEHTFLTKSGDPGVVLKVNGIDYESLDFAARDSAVKRFEAAFRTLDERTRVYQILRKEHAAPIPAETAPNALIEAALEQRARHLEQRAKELYKLSVYFVFIRESSMAAAGALAALQAFPRAPFTSVRRRAHARFAGRTDRPQRAAIAPSNSQLHSTAR